eukprot:SAG31_NODE_701_length_12730_cov_3.008709_1_plen_646_part_00
MHTSIDALQHYHKSLGLEVGLYHLDPFWHSHHATGACDGVTASNWSHSEFHWPAGLGEHGNNPGTKWQMLYMLLAGSKFHAARWGDENATGNEYAGHYTMEDQDLPTNIWGSGMQCCNQNSQVVASESHRFWDDVLGYGYRTNNLRAMTIDTLTTWFAGFTSRINNTDAHELWLDGYLGPSHGIGPGGASKWKLPIRLDQSLPSDHMLSVARNWSALVSARLAHDAQQDWRSGGCSQFASTGLFLASLGIRPVVDVLWTTGVQAENGHGHFANGTDKYVDICSICQQRCKERLNLEHELIMATLSTGPVGIGDKVGSTNATLLNRALRSDGVILKPGFAAHRLDDFYSTVPGHLCAGDEIWSAPTVPARLVASAREDRRANSMVRLFPLDGREDVGVWWYSLLLYDLNETRCSLIPAMLSPPALSPRGYVVSRYGVICADGAVASSCVDAFSESTPLQIKTEESHTGRVGDIRLHSIAPVLPGGWALLGEQSKYVAVSPQRLVVGHIASDAEADSDSLSPDELLNGDGQFAFGVLGEPGESVAVAVLVPPKAANAIRNDAAAAVVAGKMSVVKLKVGASGRSEVECSATVGCHVKSGLSIGRRNLKTDDSANADALPDISFDTAKWKWTFLPVLSSSTAWTARCA